MPGVLPPTSAPATAPSSSGVEFTAESVAAKRAALKKELAATREELSKLTEGATGEIAQRLTQETAVLERIDAIHTEQQRTLQHGADLAKEAADVEERTRSQRPPEATFKPPLGLATLDDLYAERDYLEQAGAWLKTDVANTETMLVEARDTLEEKERARRAARQATDQATGGASGGLRLAELESRLAQETVLLRERAVRTLKLQQSLLEPKQRLLRPRLDWLRSHLTLGREEITAAEAEGKKRTVELERALATAKKDVEAITQIVISAERRAASGNVSEELESRREERQTANLALSVLTAQRERLAENAKVAGNRRRVLTGGLPAKELRTLAQENQDEIDQLTKERKRQTIALFKNRKDLQEMQARSTRAAAAEEKIATWAADRLKRQAAWVDLSEAEIVDLDRLRTARARLKEEIGQRVNLFSWRDSTAIARENVVAAWNYEVFSVKDAPVRVKTIFGVLVLVLLGHRISQWLSAVLAGTVLKRMGMSVGRRAAWQTLWFYALFIGVLVVAFDLFHISLTQFSVVSGALAVGIGFGSQNLISNFISGVILLIERPVNQGDVIEIDGRQVTVERLGPRSTIVRTVDNTHMIVPNSRLLEQPVVNWTLSDDVVRKRIRLGVAYDSPTRKTAELLQGILNDSECVRKQPAPLVKFAEFGENSLIFELYFWAGICDPVDAENELRHRIAEVFAREKIVMAVLQRDVHLETRAPLHVIVDSAPAESNPRS